MQVKKGFILFYTFVVHTPLPPTNSSYFPTDIQIVHDYLNILVDSNALSRKTPPQVKRLYPNKYSYQSTINPTTKSTDPTNPHQQNYRIKNPFILSGCWSPKGPREMINLHLPCSHIRPATPNQLAGLTPRSLGFPLRSPTSIVSDDCGLQRL